MSSASYLQQTQNQGVAHQVNSLAPEVERYIESFLAKVDRHEFRYDEETGNSAQLVCATEAVDVYMRAFEELPDDIEVHWNVLVGITSRLQSAPALRILMSNLGKRVQKNWMEAVKQCEDIAANNNGMSSPQTKLRLGSTISCLQIDDLDQSITERAGSVSGGGNISPSTLLGQFPDMQRVPTSQIVQQNTASSNGANGAGGGGGGQGGGGAGLFSNFIMTDAIENAAMMTPAARGTRVVRHRSTAHGAPEHHITSSAVTTAATSASASSSSSSSASFGGGGVGGGGGGGLSSSFPRSGSSSSSMLSVPQNSTSSAYAKSNNNNNNNNNNNKKKKYMAIVGAQDKVQDAMQELKSDLETVTRRIGEQASHHIHHDETILAFGCTNTLTSFFRAASQTVRFRVLLIDPANGSGGGNRLESNFNMTVEHIAMSNCYAVMSRVSKVFLSTEAVFANGGLVAFAGSHAVCLAAKLCTIPVIVVVASIKFSESFPSDAAGSTLIKVDQQRSVEWREFLPPSDVLPPEFGNASDAFDCMYNSSSDDSSEDEDEEEEEEDDDDEEEEDDDDDDEEEEKTGMRTIKCTLPFSSSVSGGGSTELLTPTTADASGPNFSMVLSPASPTAAGLGFGGAAVASSSQQFYFNTAAMLKRRRKLPPVEVWNPLNEYVPPDCISIFVTELHEITPALVQVFVDTLNDPKNPLR